MDNTLDGVNTEVDDVPTGAHDKGSNEINQDSQDSQDRLDRPATDSMDSPVAVQELSAAEKVCLGRSGAAAAR